MKLATFVNSDGWGVTETLPRNVESVMVEVGHHQVYVAVSDEPGEERPRVTIWKNIPQYTHVQTVGCE